MKQFFCTNKSTFVVLLLAFLLKITTYFPNFIEQFYSNAFYPIISKFLRFIFGWIPFSFGDIIYFVVIVFFGIKLCTLLKNIFRKKKINWIAYLKKSIRFLLLLYIIFNVFWGLNYHRKSIAQNLQLKLEKVDTTALQNLLEKYVNKINVIVDSVSDDKQFSFTNIQPKAIDEYYNASKYFSFIQYSVPSVKHTFYGKALNYLGISGYYNPFTGEAQINKSVPLFLIPNITLHEMAHQLGYAKEDEANFIGYIVALQSNNAYIQYSCYLDIILYASIELKFLGSKNVKEIMNTLHPTIKKHIAELVAFRKIHESIFDNISSWIFDHFLQANNVTKGIYSYNEVLMLLIAYEKQNNNL